MSGSTRWLPIRSMFEGREVAGAKRWVRQNVAV